MAANPRAELEKLGKRMMTIERDLSMLTEEIKGLQSKLADAGENGVVVSFEVNGFDEGTTIEFSVDPASACPDGASSCEAGGSTKAAQLVVSEVEGITVTAVLKSPGQEREIGKWQVSSLIAEPVEEEVALSDEPEQAAVASVSSLKITAVSTGDSLAEQIAAKEKEVDELTKQRGAVRDEKQKLIKLSQQQEEGNEGQEQQPGQGGSAAAAPAGDSKSARWRIASRALEAPKMAFQVAATLVSDPRTRPLRDITYFITGVVLLKYFGDDLAV